ncbi:hypothetical protein EPA93_20770 [Ktedonosporobacter rubrisoli]|uniref:Peptidase C39-like domain-containing protein n=1 Tax=Ktedonosporobacter rubrisoli TaxID=2509675 RepID=A0A4P6JSR5_KTERU|nr:C39 family peptidase [Ktedonosporobacter rubrisoli]QBD78300.1 hypothetical protein EPA93_20770 [Ktedonosporobacter rubrisoli]
MIILLTLLAIALTVTVAGLLLSSRPPQETDPRPVSYAGRSTGARRTGTRSYVRSRSYVNSGFERRGRRSWASVGTTLDVRSILGLNIGMQGQWLGVALISLVIFFAGILLLRACLPTPTIVAANWPDIAVSSTSAPAKTNATTNKPAQPLFAGMAGASKALVRIPQLDPAQYFSAQDYNTWAYSACSTASMTEVINSYGHHYRIADILKVEAGIHEITPDLGLLEPGGIDRTVAHFNFQATWIKSGSLDEVISIANKGRPVIVGFPPERWSGGHLLVVRGGDKDHVYTADSSRLDMQVFTHQNFNKYWAGFAVVITPK